MRAQVRRRTLAPLDTEPTFCPPRRLGTRQPGPQTRERVRCASCPAWLSVYRKASERQCWACRHAGRRIAV